MPAGRVISETMKARVETVKQGILSGMTRSAMLAKWLPDWQSSPRAIDRYISQAQKSIRLAREAREKMEMEVAEKVARSAERRRLLSRDEKREILAKIASGDLLVEKVVATKDGFKKILCPPDHADRIKAIDLENKMQGHYAADRIQLEGEGLAPTINIITVAPRPEDF